MALAAVHLDPNSRRVLGVWLDADRAAYLNTGDQGYARSVGQDIMDQKGVAPTWDEWARHLADSWPKDAHWQAIPREDGEEAGEVLARAVAQEAVTKRAEQE